MRFPSSCSKRFGLSLAEVMLVMTLVLVVTGLMAGLVREYSELIRFGRGKTHTVEAAKSALLRMSGEIAEAYQISIPPAGSTTPVHEVAFERLNPDPTVRDERLPPVPPPTPPAWQPFAPTARISVRYQLSSRETLLRTVGGEEQTLAADITDLTVTNLPTDGLTISVSTRESRRIRTLSTHLYLPAPLVAP